MHFHFIWWEIIFYLWCKIQIRSIPCMLLRDFLKIRCMYIWVWPICSCIYSYQNWVYQWKSSLKTQELDQIIRWWNRKTNNMHALYISYILEMVITPSGCDVDGLHHYWRPRLCRVFLHSAKSARQNFSRQRDFAECFLSWHSAK